MTGRSLALSSRSGGLRRGLVGLGLSAGLLLALVPAVSAPALADGSTQALDRARTARGLKGAKVGVLVVRASDGAVLYEHAADTAMVPASNMKILTAMAALEAFGPSHRFRTRVVAPAPLDAAGVTPSITIVGDGDPVLNSEDWWLVAAALKRDGLSGITGGIVVDDSAFDSERAHPDWGRVSSRAYHAPIGALTANYGSFFVEVEAGKAPGDPVVVAVDPPLSYFNISNRAKTGSNNAKRSLVVDRGPAESGEMVVVRGVLRAGDESDRFPRSSADPALYAGALLASHLEALGVSVEGGVRRGLAPSEGHELLDFQGRSLSEIVELFVKYSNNAIAEMLVKSLGRRATGGPGSWSTGLVAMTEGLDRMGVLGDGTRLVDGSGLSTRNRISARTLVGALQTAHRSFEIGPEFMSALPIAGIDGTLKKRTRGAANRVRAKTGLLSDARVTSLSGFARLADDDLAIFAILVNGYQGGSRAAMDGVDRWVAELVRMPGGGKSGSADAGTLGATNPAGASQEREAVAAPLAASPSP